MRLSAGQWRRSLATCQLAAILGFMLGSASPAYNLQASRPDAPRLPDDQRDIERVASDTLDRITLPTVLTVVNKDKRLPKTMRPACFLP